MNSHGRDLFIKFKPIIKVIQKICLILPKKIRIKMFNRLSSKRGLVAIGKRYILLSTLAARLGDNVRINENCYIHALENLSIGSNVSIWPMSYLECSGGLSIGDDVSIAHGVTIMTEEHKYGSLALPIKYQGKKFAPVIIESNVWIGAKSTILSGVTIKSGAVVAAGAIVTADVSENVIVAGVPARKIKSRC